MSRRQVLLIAGAAVVTLLAGTLIARWNTDEPAAQGDSNDPGRAATAEVNAPTVAETSGGRSEDGAVRLALAYATASQRWLYLSDEDLEVAVRAAATPAAAERLAGQVLAEVRAAREALAGSPGRVWWLVRPLAWRVESFGPDAARVAVWTVTVLSAADVAVPQAEWVTVTVDLVWWDEGWRLDAVADRPGPTPMAGVADPPWQPEPFDEALDEFSRLDGEELVREGR